MSSSYDLESATDFAAAGPNAADARLESALTRMTLEELNCLQDDLHAQLRAGLPSTERIATALELHDVDVAGWLRFRESRDDAIKVVMLLGAVGVAIAWMTYRHMPAPTRRLQDAVATVREDHVYMLPIPRNDPCFCGSGGRFRACHGKLPAAVPMTASAYTNR